MVVPSVSPQRPLVWPEAIQAIRSAVLPANDIYIVGGAVRDAYLHRPLHDIDLAAPRDGRPIARRIADRLNGAYYPLDPQRGVGRALVQFAGEQLTVDVAQFRDHDLNTDLLLRDFTVNAMAVHLTGDLQAVLDPLGGLDDLQNKLLRECSAESIKNDPIRALRAVRTSAKYGLLIETSTRLHIRQYGPELANVSIERVRDELFQILDADKPSAPIASLLHLGLLDQIFPELPALRGVEQGPPHQYDVLRHTLTTLDHLSTVLHILKPRYNDSLTGNMQFGLLSQALFPNKTPLAAHISRPWPNNRTHRSLLMFAALLHDSGKPYARSIDEDGRVHFHQHDQIGARLAAERAQALRLSNDESQRVTTIVEHHMRPHWLYNTRQPLTARAIYRFWRDTGPAGVDICLLAMADFLATYGPTLDVQSWIDYLEMIQRLLDSYFQHHDIAIAPPPVLTGQDLIERFGLQPGPQIGMLLERVREAQVEGTISTYEEALEWVQRLLDAASQNN